MIPSIFKLFKFKSLSFSSVVITPEVVTSLDLLINPSFLLTSMSVTPDVSASLDQVVLPSIILGPLTFTPSISTSLDQVVPVTVFIINGLIIIPQISLSLDSARFGLSDVSNSRIFYTFFDSGDVIEINFKYT